MLSRKQLWRQAKAAALTISQLSNRAEKEIENHTRTSSVSGQPQFSFNNCTDENNAERKLSFVDTNTSFDKVLRFAPFVEVLLIPTREEQRKFSSGLFWNDSELSSFKQDAVKEIRQFMLTSKDRTKNLSPKMIIRLLYQPYLDESDPEILEPVVPSKCPAIDNTIYNQLNTSPRASDKKSRKSSFQSDSKMSSCCDYDVKKCNNDSSDDDETESCSQTSSNSNSEQKMDVDIEEENVINFVQGVRTDVELNRLERPTRRHDDDNDNNDTSKLTITQPTHTPSHAHNPDNTLWAIKWRRAKECVA